MNRDRLSLIVVAALLVLGVAAMVQFQGSGPDDESLDDTSVELGEDSSGDVSRHKAEDLDAEEPDQKPATPESKIPDIPTLDAPKADCAHVTGRVVDIQKKPIAGAVIALCLDISDFRSRARLSKVIEHTQSDENGFFSLEDVHVGEIYSLRGESPGFASKYVTGLQLDVGRSKHFELVMHEGVTLKGLVTDLGDAPIAGARVRVVDVVMQVTDKLGGVEREAVTDSAGRFKISNLNQGFKTLEASGQGYAAKQMFNYHVHPTQSQHDIVFKLGPGERMFGKVVDDDGVGVAGCEVTAQPHDGRTNRLEKSFQKSRTNELGEFEFPGLKRGSYYLTCRKLGYYSPNLRDLAQSGGGLVTIRLKQNPVIRGRVVDAATQQPLKKFTLYSTPRESLLFVSENAKQHFVSEDGTFEFRCLRNEGDAFLHLEAKGYASGASGRIVLNQQRTIDGILVKAQRGATAIGRVVDSAGEPVSGAQVEMETVPEGSEGLGRLGSMVYGKLALLQRKVRTDKDGRFRITRLRHGTYRLHVTSSRHAALRGVKLHRVEKGGEMQMGEIVLRRGGSLSGVAYDKNDTVLVNCLVKLVPESAALTGGFDIETKTDSQGRFRFKHLAAGGYKLQIIRTARLAQLAGQIPGVPTASYITVFVAEGEERKMDVRGL